MCGYTVILFRRSCGTLALFLGSGLACETLQFPAICHRRGGLVTRDADHANIAAKVRPIATEL